MEFGLFMGGYVPEAVRQADPDAEHTRLLSEVALAEVGDRHNWKYSWWTEHHFLLEYSHISANEVIMPYVLARTERMHIGSGIINITPPVNHPARVAERVAMLDHLSGGRFEFGTGRGSSSIEQRGFGIDDPDDTKAMFDEVIGEFKHMWRDGLYSHAAASWSLPERNVLPKPWVKPHPPMWVAAGNPSTFEKAARMGLGVLCFTGGSPEKMRPLIEIYKERIGDAEPVGEYVNDNVAVTTSFMCLDDGDEAIDWVTRSGNGHQQSLVFHYLDTFPKPAWVPEWPAQIPDPTRDQILAGRETGASIVGTPSECTEALKKWEAIGVDQLIMGPSGSVYPQDLVAHTVALFGDEVIPRYDTDPEHSTSRYRRLAAANATSAAIAAP
ncbi:MAG TPA: LLM class flavin-dependent oxidoreductase [Acidimicrobiia bacterium]|jgi:alkanesulfonate monooxygenase SsuD/methylene tetrahydromethanopterin reductase-like flavin-dependent oxidoreductase (luciferase family)